MVIHPLSPDMQLPLNILKMEMAIKEIPHWQFAKRYKAKRKLSKMRIAAAYIGFELAIKDLEKAGLIKRI